MSVKEHKNNLRFALTDWVYAGPISNKTDPEIKKEWVHF